MTEDLHLVMPEVHIKLHALYWKHDCMFIRHALNGILIGDGKCVMEELAPRHEIVPGEPIEDIPSLGDY